MWGDQSDSLIDNQTKAKYITAAADFAIFKSFWSRPQQGKGPSLSSKRLSKIKPKEVLQHSMASASTPLQSLVIVLKPMIFGCCNCRKISASLTMRLFKVAEAIFDLERVFQHLFALKVLAR
ncbi:hypothetical protein GQX74_007848 [Glossina fuscipes]|nr:hypothetical protein GQX74_007848 [Glossina fuscipes]